MTDRPALQRLDRLEAYLRQDPDNISLLAEAFEAALQAGEWARAELPLRHAQALGTDPARWQLREAHWLFAQERWDEAEPGLQALSASPEASAVLGPVLAHDLAYLALRRGQFTAGL